MLAQKWLAWSVCEICNTRFLFKNFTHSKYVAPVCTSCYMENRARIFRISFLNKIKNKILNLIYGKYQNY